jgi:glycosyltransferase involved in cell wall biosynthesis
MFGNDRLANKMKITLASSQFPPTKSGYSRTAYELFKNFSEAGNDIRLVTEESGCKRVGKVALLSDEGKKLLSEKCDIVQVIGPSPLFSEQCVKYALSKGKRVVYVVSAMPGLSSFYYNPAAPFIDKVYEKLYLKRTLGKVDLAVFHTRDHAANCNFYPWSNKVVIPGGVNGCCLNYERKFRASAIFSPEFSGKKNREGIAFVGQLRKYKGIPYLILALGELREKGLDTTLKIVGEGPDRERIEKMVRKLGLEDRVFLLGAIDEYKLHEVYSSSRVLVLPSTSAESFGIVLVEAASHGLPVIASDLPGVRELALSLGGTVSKPGDSHALAQKIAEVLLSSSPMDCDKNTVSSEFAWSKIAQTYLNTFRDLVELGGPQFVLQENPQAGFQEERLTAK